MRSFLIPGRACLCRSAQRRAMYAGLPTRARLGKGAKLRAAAVSTQPLQSPPNGRAPAFRRHFLAAGRKNLPPRQKKGCFSDLAFATIAPVFTARVVKWHTRMLEVHVERSVGVRVPPRAPSWSEAGRLRSFCVYRAGAGGESRRGACARAFCVVRFGACI